MQQNQLIENLLRVELGAEFAAQDAGTVEDLAWDAALAVLHEEGMSPEEEAALDEAVAAEAADPVASVLGLRIERALRAGLATAGESKSDYKTEVLVLRAPEGGSRDDEGRTLAAALARLRAGLSAGLKGSEDRLIVVAAKQLYDKLKQVMPVGRVGGKPMIEYCDQGPPERSTTAAIEIVAGEVKLAQLEDRATVRLSGTFSDSLEDDSMRAAWLAAATPSIGTPETPETPSNGTLSDESMGGRETLGVFDSSAPEALEGALFHNKYRIIRVIGKGGFGAVYEAEDERGAGNRVAIKVLSGKAAESAAQQQSFKDEARRVTRLSHPNIVDWKVFDETENGTPYFVMELVEGEEFEATLRRERRLAPDRAAKLLLQVLDALRAAHHLSRTESILHLDLKPANLFCIPARANRPEQLKVIDFGIGQYIGDGEVRDESVVPAEGVVEGDLSGPGTLTFKKPTDMLSDGGRVTRSKGCTPEYASPEQCAHVMYMQDILALDGRSDLYSLGVIAFEMLTGQLPFKSRTRLDVMRMHREDPAPRVGSMGVKIPRKLAKFVDRCLEKDRDERWKNTQEAYQYLHSVVHPPVWKAVAKVTVPVVLVLAALGSWAWMARDVVVPTASVFDAAGVALDNQPLYLGAAKPVAELELQAAEGVLPDEPEGTWAVQSAADGTVLPGWTANWTDGGGVRLAAPDGLVGRVQEQLELVLDEDRARSRAMRVVWIGPESWAVDRVMVGDRSSDLLTSYAVDPYSMSLDLWARGESRDDLAEVSVQVADEAPHRLGLSSGTGDQVRYRLDLADARLATGTQSMQLRVVDRAGNEWSEQLELSVVEGTPELQRVALVDRSGNQDAAGQWPETNKILGAYSITPRTRPALRIELGRPADVHWRVFTDASTEPALVGRSEGRRSIEAQLDELTGLNGGDPFRGRIELVADESAYVLHAPGSDRHLVRRELSFSFEDTLPTFAAEWRAAGRSSALALADQDAELFTNAAQGEVVVTREQPVPMRVEASWWPTGRPDEARRSHSDDLYNPQVQQAALPIALDADGEWTVRLASYRYDAQADSLAERPDVEVTTQLVLDRVAPSAVLVGLDEGTVLRESSDSARALRVSYDGSGSMPREAAVDLDWRVERGGPGGDIALSGQLAGQDPLAGSESSLEAFWTGSRALTDGSYRLEVSGIDRAGNQLAASSVTFEVSKLGPAVELLEPSGVGKWHRDPVGKRWLVRVRASDPNGVDSVSCELLAGELAIPIELELEDGSAADEHSLIARYDMPYNLSENRVRLRFVSTDTHGSLSEWISPELELPTISRPAPDRIAGVFGDNQLESMRLVRGNDGFQYLFGGRGDEVENPDFLRAGLGAFNDSPRRSRSRSWQVPFKSGTIESYYLDEREVSVQQYLQFIDDPGGYADAAHWPGDHRPDSARRNELRAELAQRRADYPATGVSWAEAHAYADWAGKRLPSWVEWEFAVRGGASYRPYASFGSQVVEASLNGSTTMQAELGPRGARDWTADRKLADLCGNVAEWTATGMRASDDSARYPHQWALEDPSRLQARDTAAHDYWVVGGHYGKARGDFTVADQRPADFRHETIGFRCALSLVDYQDRLGLQSSDGPSFEEQQ